MDKYNIHNMLEDISQSASTELSKGIDQVNNLCYYNGVKRTRRKIKWKAQKLT